MSKVAIVAALEREVRPLVRGWKVNGKQHEGRRFRFFEKDDVVVVCGGIGAAAARRATEAIIALYAPNVVWSAGFAGALDPTLKVGDLVQPRRLVNAGDGSSVRLDRGQGVLVSFAGVASPQQKAKLRDSFLALAVDMEASAVARAAEARQVEFRVVKVISDEADFVFPAMERFVDAEGKFAESKFAFFAVLRPWLWPRVVAMARNSTCASQVLCRQLGTSDLKPGGAVGDGRGREAVNR
jgi:adenosylhomocysteine nucleosidase